MRQELERLLEQAVGRYFERGKRVARGWDPGPMPRLDRVISGTLGRDVDWLEDVASGQLEMAFLAEVAAVRRRVLEDLYSPLAGEEPVLPPDFDEAPLGQLLAAAEAQAARAEEAVRAKTEAVATSAPSPPAMVPASEPPPSREQPTEAVFPVPSTLVSPAEWLLGEGAIRLMLYLGGLLVVIAATIFVMQNWGNFPGYLKFGSIFGATLGVYLLGYTLYNTILRMAGVTFIAIGSMIAPLNFYALYQFVLKPTGAPPEGAMILGSAFCFGLYLVTGWWLRTSILSYAAAVSLAAAMGSVLSAANAPGYLYGPTGLVVAGLILVLAYQSEVGGLPNFVTTPFRRSALAFASLLTLGLLATAMTTRPQLGPAWNSMIFGLLVASAVFAYRGHNSRELLSRGVAYCLIPIAYILFLMALKPPTLVAGAAVMTLGIVYLVVSFASPFRSYGVMDQWGLRLIGYVLAVITTGLALGRTQDLILALAADVAILAGSAYAYRDRDWWIAWAWGAIALFVIPWLLVFTLLFPASLYIFGDGVWSPAWSLGLALLCGNYLVFGAILRRWNLSLAAGFVSVALLVLPLAALMSAIFAGGLAVGTGLLAASVLVYGAVAAVSGRAWLLHITLPLLNVTIWTAMNLFIPVVRPTAPATIGTYVALSLIQLYGARWLETRGYAGWAVPVYIWGIINMMLAFTDALYAALVAGAAIGFRIRPHTGLSSQTMTFMAVSVLYAAALFHFAWLTRRGQGWLARWLSEGVMTYLGLTVLAGAMGWGLFDSRFAQHHFALMAGWLLLSALVGRALPEGELSQVYGKPLQNFSLVVVWLPLILVFTTSNALAIAVVYMVAAVMYGIQAFYRRSRELVYVAGLLGAVAYGGMLQWQRIYELQAYTIPYSLGVLVAAYWESPGRLGYFLHPKELPLALTWGGLGLLYGSSLAQSLGPNGGPYIGLVAVETVIGLLWGLRIRSRSWVTLSSGFLILEAVLQLIDEIAALPAWVFLGSAGVILLTVGVLALAKRQEILAMGQAVSKEWETWGI